MYIGMGFNLVRVDINAELWYCLNKLVLNGVKGLSTDAAPIIEIRKVSKSFPGVRALHEVDLEVHPGEVHALCGENGAGKSTLIKILAGACGKDSGDMLFNGDVVNIRTPQQALELGISCIYQELSIVPQLDVAKNIFLGNMFLKGKAGFLDHAELYRQAQNVLDNVIKLRVGARTKAEDLSVAQQQMVEIGRALTRRSKLIIMDEPTSSLSEKEAQTLFGLIRELKNDGITIIYITHKLDEVMALSDRITVLRDGEKITTVNTADVTKDDLIAAMLGRSLQNMYDKKSVETGGTVLEVKNLSRQGVFQDINFSLKSGEILGFFGLVGAGRTEIMRSIFGVDRYDSGQVLVGGLRLRPRSPRKAIKRGLAFVTEDRKGEGLAMRLSILVNMTVVKLNTMCRLGVINKGLQKRAADKYMQAFSIKAPSAQQLAQNLSGGNQQKVVVAKWLMSDPKVIILDEPTRGIDVGSKAEIYELIFSLAAQGMAIIIISSEIDEILGICDRINVIAEGSIKADIPRAEATNKKILTAAFGGNDVEHGL